jgi:hypothetical protein
MYSSFVFIAFAEAHQNRGAATLAFFDAAAEILVPVVRALLSETAIDRRIN